MRLDVKQTAAVADNLRAADCQPELIAAFIKCLATGEEQKGLQLLQQHRAQLLARIHNQQQYLDHLDHLLYQLKKCKPSKNVLNRKR